MSNKWNWVKDNEEFAITGDTYRLYRYKEVDTIVFKKKITSVFQFELMSKNVEFSNDYINKYLWLKDCYFIMDLTADMGASYIYQAIKSKQFDYGCCLDYGFNDGSELGIPLHKFNIVGDEYSEIGLQYILFAHDIIKDNNNHSLLFDSISNSDWDRLIDINQKFPNCLTPIALLKEIKDFSSSELEIELDTYNAENSWDTVSCSLATYQQHQENHITLAKLLHLYDFMTADSNWKTLNYDISN